ncbi:hypothetical protein IOK49_00980 [Fervidicoccus fontis]|uniref:Cren protein n=2 Tax=Fervidicoccus fontis TaxID=683846 RepID=I0A2S6_FERFK|nr:hypothetical protein [Fervidicoccus fontis]AFH43283.1 hypothetical protein FFONT_1295 [Fervidicoccus fontis Kam940]MBE9390661.1 hypothetical protein [Fervidicoccus fontis]PMB75814.1 MAG: hypothetical protein C0188_01750 [Fervidicoccus fontis]PMB76533.1 MAG: hypothetical protein C0177_05990 [Fervidicoccus fontis]HEW63863.1 hypothetical protein [Fervidicoccus fontis]
MSEGISKKKMIEIELKSISDLARLCATTSPIGQTMHIIRYESNNETRLGIIAILRDFYELRGIPIFYYVKCAENDNCKKSHYISFRITENGENVAFADKNIPGTIMIPIIDIKELPGFLMD